jgi:hypothetical protein
MALTIASQLDTLIYASSFASYKGGFGSDYGPGGYRI